MDRLGIRVESPERRDGPSPRRDWFSGRRVNQSQRPSTFVKIILPALVCSVLVTRTSIS
jgi:hypothetical protein